MNINTPLDSNWVYDPSFPSLKKPIQFHQASQSKNILAKPECNCNMLPPTNSPALPLSLDARQIEEAK
ncbi:MAG: hypothetical protein ABSC04_10870 [Syntrophobacteraceae bacterium]|jgi:hypothetical protein